jgi:hypothetical protein
VDEAGFEPAASAMPTLRSFQADLLALEYFTPDSNAIKRYGKRFPKLHTLNPTFLAIKETET